jgi:TPR repeat protein
MTKEIFETFKKAAEQGNDKAQNNLGVCYANGLGVKQDLEKAAKWWTKAAQQGYASAQNNLGVCYENGLGVKQDLEKAAKWYTAAA